MEISPPESLTKSLMVPNKTLMGPGPTNCSTRVLDAMSNPLLGHLHPECLQLMDEIKEGLKYAFQTRNEVTLCISASGHGGMEAALCNTLEDGDVALIGSTGIWGHRAADIASRYGADVRLCESRFGYALTLKQIEEAFEAHKPQLFFIAQGDSSTGIVQPFIREIGDLCRKYDCLLVVDTVASLGSTEFLMDEWNVDIAYSGSQKVFGGPPGLSPISFSYRAMNRIRERATKPKVYYFDIELLGQYWGCFGGRLYHHTISSTLLYGFREALAAFCSQGLRSVISRHNDCSLKLQEGIEDIGLELLVSEPKLRLSTIHAIKVPKGVDWKKVTQYAMNKYRLEISGGLGPTVDLVFRVGIMGENAVTERVELVLNIMREAIQNTSSVILNEKSKF